MQLNLKEANCFKKAMFNCRVSESLATQAYLIKEDYQSAVVSLGSCTNFKEFVKYDGGVVTTSMQQSVEQVCIMKQKEEEEAVPTFGVN
jgi:hypothetical protein